MPTWTNEQLRAIEARGSSILLSAAAGSGKTTVLVERVLRLIANDGADVGRMLVVTFTRAAASDMRTKLSRQLNERAAAGDERCREQLLKLEQANISTLHAFCSDFLRTNFESAGVDPAFRVLDDAMDARLRDEALHSAVMQLPEKLRLTVTLYYIDGFSMRETARILHCPEGTVKQRLHRARTALRTLLEEEV